MNFAIAIVLLVLIGFIALIAFAALRGLRAGQRQFAEDLSQWFKCQRFAPQVIIFGTAILAVVFNMNFMELLAAGKLPSGTKPIEGMSRSQLYWIYVAGSGVLALVIDFKIVRFFWQMKKHERKA